MTLVCASSILSSALVLSVKILELLLQHLQVMDSPNTREKTEPQSHTPHWKIMEEGRCVSAPSSIVWSHFFIHRALIRSISSMIHPPSILLSIYTCCLIVYCLHAHDNAVTKPRASHGHSGLADWRISWFSSTALFYMKFVPKQSDCESALGLKRTREIQWKYTDKTSSIFLGGFLDEMRKKLVYF